MWHLLLYLNLPMKKEYKNVCGLVHTKYKDDQLILLNHKSYIFFFKVRDISYLHILWFGANGSSALKKGGVTIIMLHSCCYYNDMAGLVSREDPPWFNNRNQNQP